jgi:CheY-like chemotaxis protein
MVEKAFNSEKKRILLVDDQPDVRRLFKKIIEKDGYDVTTAENGLEAPLEKIKKVKPDLVIMDIMMPEMDGWDVVKNIRADRSTSELPIIMISVKGVIEDKLKSTIAGADRHLTKPISSTDILRTINSLLQES